MNSEYTDEARSGSPDAPREAGNAPRETSREASNAPREATILVRGETIRDQDPMSPSKKSSQKNASQKDASNEDNSSADSSAKSKDKDKPARKEVSAAKVELQSRLPALDDDADVGVQKEHVVTRDGKADLAFTGTLVASAAPSSAPKGEWQEYRVYETTGGKHVFSKLTRKIEAEEEDSYEAEVFDPSPSSMPSQLLRSARDLTRTRPLLWTDAAVAFFGYDPLAKALYRKLGGDFEEHIN